MKSFILLLSITSLTVLSFAGTPEMNEFNIFEKSHIRVATKGLFTDKNNFTVDFSEYKPNEFYYPLPKSKVISFYGGARRHAGIDLKTKANDTIRAVFDGVVRMAKSYGAYGNVIVIRHKNGLESIYSHNSKNLVCPGNVVKAGWAIALTGRTGRATTEHLHFELRVDGQHFNPALVLDTKNHAIHKVAIHCKKMKNGVDVKQIVK